MANVLGELFQNIADAIRSKTGSTDKLKPNQFPEAIEGITTGGGSSADVRYVTFRNESTGEEYKKAVAVGDDCVDVVAKGLWKTPTKESTAQYNYTFYGWGASDGGAADANILKNITEDKTVYAIFTATVRYYTITYLDDDGVTVLNTESLAYGTVPNYVPTKAGYFLTGWVPEATEVTGDVSYIASWGTAPTLENSTWGEIKAYTTSGEAKKFFAPGDTKTVTTTDGTTVVFELNRFHGNDLLFVTKYLAPFTDSFSTGSSSETYQYTSMKKRVDTFRDTLPQDMKDVMKMSSILCNSGTNTNSNSYAYLYMWVPSIGELGLANKTDNSYQLDVSSGLIRKTGEDAAYGSFYYTRSWINQSSLYAINSSGTQTTGSASTSGSRVLLCFRIAP